MYIYIGGSKHLRSWCSCASPQRRVTNRAIENGNASPVAASSTERSNLTMHLTTPTILGRQTSATVADSPVPRRARI